jgi:integrase
MVLAMSDYLRREADSFVFRRRIPAAIQSRLGLKEIYRSLKTTVRRTAKARAAHLFLVTEKLFRMIEDDDVLSDEDVKAAVRHWLGSSALWRHRLDEYLPGLSPASLRTHHEALPDILLNMGKNPDASSEDNLIEEAWTALEYSDYAGWGTGETLAKTKVIFHQTLKEYVDRRVQEVFEPMASSGRSIVGTVDQQSTLIPWNMSLLSTYIQAWQTDIRKGYNGEKLKKPGTANPYKKDVELFIGLMGDLPVSKITHDIASEFRTKLLGLPATHGKSRTGSLKKELLLAKANKSTPRISMKTAKRHFSGLTSMWRWLVHKKHIPAKIDPFLGHSFPGTRSTKSARDAWSSENMRLLFTSHEYQVAHRQSAMHWLPLISLHTGMRLEEICRLRPAHDFAIKDGIYCLVIQEREGWDPKSEAGARVIPVHSWLIDHGLKNLVQSTNAIGSDHLFPELKLEETFPGSGELSLSKGFSRDFSRIKIALGVPLKTAFHSFRHTFRTELESTDHKESHIDAVMGHEPGKSEGRVYIKGVTIRKLQEVVESFTPTLDLSSLLDDAVVPAQEPLRKQRENGKVIKRKLVPPVFDDNGKVVRPRASVK